MFERPYEYLRNERAGFSPEIRFVLNSVLEGDPLALEARDSHIAASRKLFLWEDSPLDDTPWRTFFAKHDTEFQTFLRNWKPWYRPGGRSPEAFERDPDVDRHLDAAILGNLSAFGFRRLVRSFRSDVLPQPIVIRWDKGTWRMSLAIDFRFPSLDLDIPFLIPFGFSGEYIEFCKAANVGARLQEICCAWAGIFPGFLEAVRKGFADAEATLETATPGP